MSIVENRKAWHDYSIETKYQAGIILEGWEVKAIRAGRASLQEAYVFFRDGAFYLLGSHIAPLPQASSYSEPNATRTRKLLLNQAEIDKMAGKVATAGYTVVPLNLHYHNGRVKVDIGLAKGKKQHDKRAAEKEREGKREVARAMKSNGKE
jgi:SsrA-binding protein